MPWGLSDRVFIVVGAAVGLVTGPVLLVAGLVVWWQLYAIFNLWNFIAWFASAGVGLAGLGIAWRASQDDDSRRVALGVSLAIAGLGGLGIILAESTLEGVVVFASAAAGAYAGGRWARDATLGLAG